MALVTLQKAKQYLRIDSSDEDALIRILLSSARNLCRDVARLSGSQWAILNGDVENDGTYTAEEIRQDREILKVAILYTTAYLFEHREEADHHDLVLTLRSLLFSLREGVNE